MTFKSTHEWCLLNVFVKRPSWVYFLEDFLYEKLKDNAFGYRDIRDHRFAALRGRQ
jgi:hypothetical protein